MSRVRDVAQVAGVSVATVYKVFNEDYTTSEDVQMCIRDRPRIILRMAFR